MYTHAVPRAADLLPRHSVVNQWDLLAPLGIEACDPARDAVQMADDPEASARVGRRLSEAGIRSFHTLIVIHVSAGNAFRRWPADSFVELVVTLARRDPNRRFMLLSGPSDTAAAQAVAASAQQQLGSDAARISHEEFDLVETRALTEQSAVYIGGDSGPLHLAATTMTPIVALLGPTLPERSMPWRDPRVFAEAVDMGALPCRPCHQRVCEPGDFRCLTQITAARVAAAVERALASRGVEPPALTLQAHRG
jgi:ADP-heptose:LPS heptosyltransferase